MAPIDPLLALLQKNSRSSVDELATLSGLTSDEVTKKLAAWESDGTILGHTTIIDDDRAGDDRVRALIEVKLSPERGGGFDRMAMRIARFEHVKECHLMSGGYDILVVVEGDTLREVARFVAEKLSTLDAVNSTATHFQLKAYKEAGFLSETEIEPDRLPVSP